MNLQTVCGLVLVALSAQACADGAIKPLLAHRCTEVELPADFNPADPESMRKALKGGPRILYALGQDQRPALKRLLADGENPNVCILNGSVLSMSASAGRLEEVRILLDGGAHPDKPLDSSGGSPLLSALGMAHFDVAQLLLARGANARQTTDGGMTALHELAMAATGAQASAEQQQLDLAKELIRQGVAVNAQVSVPRTTALMFAALRGNKNLVSLLLSNGADANLSNARGETALSFAQKKGHAEVADLLAKAAGKS